MNATEAKHTISEIAGDIIRKRGDIHTSRVKQWGNAYAWWRDACELLTVDEIDDAIWEGRREFLDALADDHEEARFEERGEAAYGRDE